MSDASDTRPASEAELAATVRELMSLVYVRAKRQTPFPKRGSEEGPITVAHLRQLQAEIASLIRAESARGSRSGFMVNALFYALGVATSILVDFVKAHGSFW
jgi:hypothetical protein